MATTTTPAPENKPAYKGIKEDLRTRIDSGELPEGARVASENVLAQQLGISRNQTRQALRELELEGYVMRRRGSGTYVAPRNRELATLSQAGAGAAVMIFPQYLSGYCSRVVEGFMRHMSEAGRQTITYNWQKDQASELRLLRAISDSGSGGLVAWLEHDDQETQAVVRELRSKRFPIVLVDRYLHNVDVDCVLSDNVEIGYRLTKALLDRGHRRIAFAGWFREAPSSLRGRLEGYRRALAETGIDYDESLVGGELRHVEENALSVVRTYMALADRPTAFVCVHDRLAKLFYEPLIDLGYRVPESVALAAVQDRRPPERNDVPMITLEQQAHQIGTRSAELLLQREQNPEGGPQHCLIEPAQLIEEQPRPGS